jgi:synaptobrevin family protein YKT6
VLTCERLAVLTVHSYFTRGTYQEHLNFGVRTVIQRTAAGVRQSVGLSEIPYLVHSYVRHDGLAGVVVTNKDYAPRVAYTLINKMMSDYEAAWPAWKQTKQDQQCEPDQMKKDIITYQNPAEADKLTKIQKNLDDVKGIMQVNIEQILARGETLDTLMDKSEDLSASSLTFYKQAKKTNSCRC